MAGDVDLSERLICARQEITEGAEAVATVTGKTTHSYGPHVMVAEVPAEAAEELQQVARESLRAQVAMAPGEINEGMREMLDEVESLGLAAFELRSSERFGRAKASRPHGGEPWDAASADVKAPDQPEGHVATEESPAGAAATSARLTGSVAVGILIVEGPTPELTFSQEERVKVVAEVQNGLAWLGAQSSPSGIRWVYDIKVLTLDVPPGEDSLTLQQKEALWRDPAMAKLGYGPGLGGVQSYIEDLRKSKQTDWSYAAFFTKYPLGWFAYATIGGPRLVMAYDCDGWGPDNIDRVFAHETGHIFGAPDEYKSSNCNCGGWWGYFKAPNGNCETCATDGGVPCIMKSNSWEMCAYTPQHLGFPQGARYTGVFAAGSGSHGLWTLADWQSFVQKWQEWSGQGLRLVDLAITQIGGALRYSGAFRQGDGPYGLWVLATWPTFVQKWQEWSGQGLRLVDLEITRIGSELRYSGVFTAGSGGYGLWVLANWSNFVQKWQEWSAAGLRLADLVVTDVGGQLRYSGVFVSGSGSYGLWVLANWDSFVQKWQQWSEQGLRLVDIERTQVGSDIRYSGVFRQASGGYALWVGATWPSFREQWLKWSDAGLRLIDFEVSPTGVEAVASPEADGRGQGTQLQGRLGLGEAAMATHVLDGVLPHAPGFGELALSRAAIGAEPGVGFGAAPLLGTPGTGAGRPEAAVRTSNGDVVFTSADIDEEGMGAAAFRTGRVQPAVSPGEQPHHALRLDARSGVGAGQMVKGEEDREDVRSGTGYGFSVVE